MRAGVVLPLAGLALVSHSRTASAQTWDAAGQFSSQNGNPNGVWTYGEYDNVTGLFKKYQSFSGPAETPAWGGDSDIYLNDSGHLNYGVDPGNLSLHADYGTPVLRFTAPTAGDYLIDVSIGGTTQFAYGGFGNNDAILAGVNINGQADLAGSYSGLTNLFTLYQTVVLHAGDKVDVYVGHRFIGGNTNTSVTFSRTVTPEPSTTAFAISALASAGFALRRRKRA